MGVGLGHTYPSSCVAPDPHGGEGWGSGWATHTPHHVWLQTHMGERDGGRVGPHIPLIMCGSRPTWGRGMGVGLGHTNPSSCVAPDPHGGEGWGSGWATQTPHHVWLQTHMGERDG